MNPKAVLNRATQLYHNRRFYDAEKLCRQVLKLAPKEAAALRLLGAVKIKQNKPEAAEKWFRKSIRSAPNEAPGHQGLGEALAAQAKTDLAIDAFRRSIALKPAVAEAHFQLAEMLSQQGLEEQAAESFRTASEYKPDFFMAHLKEANNLLVLGRMDEGIAAYQRAIQANPKSGRPYLGLALSRVHQFSDQEIATMEAVLADSTTNKDSAICVCFALSQAFETRANYDRAFHFLEQGNRLYFDQVGYDREKMELLTTTMIDLLTAEFVARHRDSGHRSDAPIFVLGLPRSGTTLVEQILSSHTQVTGAGETDHIRSMMVERSRPAGDAYLVERFVSFSANRIKGLGQEYLNKTRQFTAATPHFVDKSFNYMFTVLIHLMLPDAKFINVRRHPVDNCLSCYQQYFIKGHNYSYDLAELGHMYRRYDRLIRLSHDLLPHHIIDVEYEDLVEDQEATTRRMFEFLSLPWEEACLRFYENKRSVKTISVGQVRQPVFKSAMGRWRRYETHLGPLLEVLRRPPSLLIDEST